jgi:hypothetical protein
MYGWIWRHLPGPAPVRLLCAVLALAVIVAVLFQWVFPTVAPHMPWQDTTVG